MRGTLVIAFVGASLVSCRHDAGFGPARGVTAPTDPSRCEPCEDATWARGQRARKRQQCDAGNAEACFWAATASHGPPWCCISAPDRDGARKLFERACEMGDALGCFEPTTPLASPRPNGSCEACVETDSQWVRALLPERERQCQDGDPAACYWVASTIHGPPWCCVQGVADHVRAWTLMANACRNGHDFACRHLFEQARVFPTYANDRVADLEQACNEGIAQACHGLGLAWEQGTLLPAQDPTDNARRALPFFERACAAGLTRGCVHVGRVLLSGRGAVPTARRAVELLQPACASHLSRDASDWRDYDGSGALACTAMAKAYASGSGTSRDWMRAHKIRQRLCAADSVGCEDLHLFPILARAPVLWYGAQAALLFCVNAFGAALLLSRRLRIVHARFAPLLAVVAAAAALGAAVQLWFYFAGSEWGSLAWLLLAVPLMWPAVEAWVTARQERRAPRPSAVPH